MDRASLRGLPLRPASRFRAVGRIARGGLFSLFVVTLVLVGMRFWLPAILSGQGHGPEVALLFLTAVTSISISTRQLPLQNVLLATAFAFGVVMGVILLNAATGIPLGPWGGGESVPKPLLWVLPLIWTGFLFVARGVAGLLLRPWRLAANYGFRVLWTTVLLALLLEINVEPFATVVNHYWSWKPTRLPINWFGTPLVALWGWSVTVFFTAVLMSPALINKSPVARPVGFGHLWIWLALNLLFIAGAIRHQLWGALIVVLAEVCAIMIAAWIVLRRR